MSSISLGRASARLSYRKAEKVAEPEGPLALPLCQALSFDAFAMPERYTCLALEIVRQYSRCPSDSVAFRSN